MLTVNIGSLALPSSQLVLLAAMMVAAAAGRLAMRPPRTGISNIVVDMLIAGAITGRVAFVLAWFEIYRNAPWSMLDIRDGGFLLPAGVAAGLLVAAWHGWRRPTMRRPLAAGLASGALAWTLMSGVARLAGRPTLPAASLTSLAGEPVELVALTRGQPLVINLWATWCPPCRREMPVLAAAQQEHRGISFVFANQGEAGATVRRYLAGGMLALDNVVLDTDSTIGRTVGSSALPTTLFYSADGLLVDVHLGELSPASLLSKLVRLGARRGRDMR